MQEGAVTVPEEINAENASDRLMVYLERLNSIDQLE